MSTSQLPRACVVKEGYRHPRGLADWIYSLIRDEVSNEACVLLRTPYCTTNATNKLLIIIKKQIGCSSQSRASPSARELPQYAEGKLTRASCLAVASLRVAFDNKIQGRSRPAAMTCRLDDG